MFDSLSERLLAAVLSLGVPLSFALHGYDFGYYVEATIFPDDAGWQRIVFGIICAPPFFGLGVEATRKALERLQQL